jgi:hypothetical protein
MSDKDEILKEEEEEDENLLEDSDYSKKSDFNKASVVQDAVNKVKDMRAKEMRTGYYNYTYNKDGSMKKEYIEDTRKSYMGSVEYLRQVLSHELATEKRMITSLKTFEEKKKKLFDKYSIQVPKRNNGSKISSEKYIPEVGEEISVEFLQNNLGSPTKHRDGVKKGEYDWEVNRYWSEMVEVYDYLFSELNILIALKEYFKQKSSF